MWKAIISVIIIRILIGIGCRLYINRSVSQNEYKSKLVEDDNGEVIGISFSLKK